MTELIWIGVVILIVAIILYALGARGTAGMTASVGKLILVVGIVLFLIMLLVGLLS